MRSLGAVKMWGMVQWTCARYVMVWGVSSLGPEIQSVDLVEPEGSRDTLYFTLGRKIRAEGELFTDGHSHRLLLDRVTLIYSDAVFKAEAEGGVI